MVIILKKNIVIFLLCLVAFSTTCFMIILITKEENKTAVLDSFEIEANCTFDFNPIKIRNVNSTPNSITIESSDNELESYLLNQQGLCEEYSDDSLSLDETSHFIYKNKDHLFYVEAGKQSDSVGWAEVSELKLYIAGYENGNYIGTYYCAFPFLFAEARSDTQEKFEFKDSPIVKSFDDMVHFYSYISSNKFIVDKMTNSIYLDIYKYEYDSGQWLNKLLRLTCDDKGVVVRLESNSFE